MKQVGGWGAILNGIKNAVNIGQQNFGRLGKTGARPGK
jgi:hypothetical protein